MAHFRSTWFTILLFFIIMKSLVAQYNEKLDSLRKLATKVSSSSPTSAQTLVETTFSPSPSQAPTLIRSSESSSSNESVLEPETTMPRDGQSDENRSKPYSWTVAIPIVTVTIMAWITKGNEFMRESVSACWTSEFCLNDEIPTEIVIRSSRSEAFSVAGDNAADIELQPISSTKDDARTDTKRLYSHTKWNLPEDPVDEISLKGPSFDSSCSVDEDELRVSRTRFVRL